MKSVDSSQHEAEVAFSTSPHTLVSSKLSLALQSCGFGTAQAAMCRACDRIGSSSSLIGFDRCRWSRILNVIMKTDTIFASQFILQTVAS